MPPYQSRADGGWAKGGCHDCFGVPVPAASAGLPCLPAAFEAALASSALLLVVLSQLSSQSSALLLLLLKLSLSLLAQLIVLLVKCPPSGCGSVVICAAV